MYKFFSFISEVTQELFNNKITYDNIELSPISSCRLQQVKRKTLVLDMDETLMTSAAIYGRFVRRPEILSSLPYDFSFTLPDRFCKFYVYKRPYVDFFLDTVAAWYDIIIYTAAQEDYANRILDHIDNGRGILAHRLYRQHCINIHGVNSKFVSIINSDLNSVFIVDNSNKVCGFNSNNSIHIKSFLGCPEDNALLQLLPTLDALRFTNDVRSVLGRCTRFDNYIKRIIY